jgi:hypothetical protein
MFSLYRLPLHITRRNLASPVITNIVKQNRIHVENPQLLNLVVRREICTTGPPARLGSLLSSPGLASIPALDRLGCSVSDRHSP